MPGPKMKIADFKSRETQFEKGETPGQIGGQTGERSKYSAKGKENRESSLSTAPAGSQKKKNQSNQVGGSEEIKL